MSKPQEAIAHMHVKMPLSVREKLRELSEADSISSSDAFRQLVNRAHEARFGQAQARIGAR